MSGHQEPTFLENNMEETCRPQPDTRFGHWSLQDKSEKTLMFENSLIGSVKLCHCNPILQLDTFSGFYLSHKIELSDKKL